MSWTIFNESAATYNRHVTFCVMPRKERKAWPSSGYTIIAMIIRRPLWLISTTRAPCTIIPTMSGFDEWAPRLYFPTNVKTFASIWWVLQGQPTPHNNVQQTNEWISSFRMTTRCQAIQRNNEYRTNNIGCIRVIPRSSIPIIQVGGFSRSHVSREVETFGCVAKFFNDVLN